MAAIDEIEKILPPALALELRSLSSRADFPLALSEIRLRRYAPSSVVLSGENLRLAYRPRPEEWDTLLRRVTGGSMYAHRDTVEQGYVSMPSGIRVGVSADVRYEGGRFRGARSIFSLVFRIPSAPSERADELYAAFAASPSGMLIYSLPGGGKTSALRALAARLGGEGNLRVVVVDERREFSFSDYRESLVDILSGYKKAKGIEIAERCMSAEVIMVDEIGSAEEAAAIASVGYGGVPIIATAHADSLESLMAKRHIASLVEAGYFKIFAGLHREGDRFSLSLENR